MEQTLLTTRVQIPPLSRSRLHRSRLIDALESGVSEYHLTHISAPAGYGKTTLLTQWARTTTYDVAWLSLSADVHSVEDFLRYLVMAWETVKPDIGDTPLGLLANSSPLDTKRTLPAFINVADSIPDALVFVLDDYHLLTDDAIHGAMSFLINNLPMNLHFIIAERGTSPLPIARYRAKNMMHELQTEDLKFLPRETGDFINDLMRLKMPSEKINGLQQQSEGWITAIHLAALTMQYDKKLPDKIISGDQRFLADYLYEDVLAHLDKATQQFLLKTSILNEFCPALCNAVTEQQNTQDMLATLERENLFLVALDNSRAWFRYHHLFRDFLRECLERTYAGDIAKLHHKAAQWYLGHDLPEQAFHHALKGEAIELVINIVERYVSAKLLGGEVRIMQQWMDALPEGWFAEYPILDLFRTSILLVKGQFDTCLQQLHELEQSDGYNPTTRGRIKALQCYVACFQNDLSRAKSLAEQAFQDLPEDDISFLHGIYGALGDTYRFHAHWDEAKACYLKLQDFRYSPAFRVQAVHIYGALADLALRQGNLHDAATNWSEALNAIQNPRNRGTYPLPLIGWVYVRIGELLYEENELSRAWEHIARGLDYAEAGGDVKAMLAGYLIAGRLKLAEADIEAADIYLEKARHYVKKSQFSYWVSRFERLQLELWLAQNKLRTAVNWSDKMLTDTQFAERPESEIAQLAMARVLLARGDAPSIERSLNLLKYLLQTAEAEGRIGIMIEVLALQAVAYWQQRQQTEALIYLERALRLAEPEGYIRLFVDIGLPMVRVLQEARTRNVMLDYVNKLLGVFETDFELSPERILPEPLTPREQDVLKLMVAGLTNPEIAEELVIAAGTVKKHAANIYGKLGVSNRTEAAKKSRDLDLIE